MTEMVTAMSQLWGRAARHTSNDSPIWPSGGLLADAVCPQTVPVPPPDSNPPSPRHDHASRSAALSGPAC